MRLITKLSYIHYLSNRYHQLKQLLVNLEQEHRNQHQQFGIEQRLFH